MKKHRILLIVDIVAFGLITVAALSFCIEALELSRSEATPIHAKWKIFTQNPNFFGNCIVVLYGIILLGISKIIEKIIRILSL